MKDSGTSAPCLLVHTCVNFFINTNYHQNFKIAVFRKRERKRGDCQQGGKKRKIVSISEGSAVKMLFPLHQLHANLQKVPQRFSGERMQICREEPNGGRQEVKILSHIHTFCQQWKERGKGGRQPLRRS